MLFVLLLSLLLSRPLPLSHVACALTFGFASHSSHPALRHPQDKLLPCARTRLGLPGTELQRFQTGHSVRYGHAGAYLRHPYRHPAARTSSWRHNCRDLLTLVRLMRGVGGIIPHVTDRFVSFMFCYCFCCFLSTRVALWHAQLQPRQHDGRHHQQPFHLPCVQAQRQGSRGRCV